MNPVHRGAVNAGGLGAVALVDVRMRRFGLRFWFRINGRWRAPW